MLHSHVNPNIGVMSMLHGHLLNLNDLYFKKGPYNLHNVYVACSTHNIDTVLVLGTRKGVSIANNDQNNFINLLNSFAGDFISVLAFCEFYDVICSYNNHDITDQLLYNGLITYCKNRGITIAWM